MEHPQKRKEKNRGNHRRKSNFNSCNTQVNEIYHEFRTQRSNFSRVILKGVEQKQVVE